MSKPTRKSPKPRAESKRATRDALLAAGIHEFANRGFDASLDSICARAKLTRGAFYVHFADRDAFVVAVMQHVLGTFVSGLTAVRTAGVDSTIRMFVAAARARSPVIRGGAGLRFHHLMEACRRSKTIGDTYRGLLMMARDQLGALVASDQRAGAVRDEPVAPALADVMVVVALGLIAVLELDVPIDVERVGATVAAMLGAAA